MGLRDLIPKTTVTPEAMEALGPVLMGQRLFNQGRYPEAETMYRQALDNFPPKSAGRVLIHNKMGILYEKTGNLGQAIESYETGVKEGALTPFTYVRLSRLHLEANRPSRALDYTRRGVAALKKARTNLPQEIYFLFIFQYIKRCIRRRLSSSQPV
jgi:tetratricopeptide (TPR) repeat protein